MTHNVNMRLSLGAMLLFIFVYQPDLAISKKIWDHGAGVMVIEEAGGRVSDIFGEKLDFSIGRTLANNKGVVVTSGKLYTMMLYQPFKNLGCTINSICGMIQNQFVLFLIL